MSKIALSGLLMLGLVACSTGAAKENEAAGKAVAGSRPSAPAMPAERSLSSGTRIGATINDSLSSRRDNAGETFTATVSDDVRDDKGYVVIPAGSSVELVIDQLKSTTNVAQKDGKLAFSVKSVSVRGLVYQVSADLEPVQHHLQGRGVSAGKVATVGVGAAAGAIAGQLIGKNAKGAVIGGAIGAGAGTAVAVVGANRDVVVSRGTPITFALTHKLSIATR